MDEITSVRRQDGTTHPDQSARLQPSQFLLQSAMIAALSAAIVMGAVALLQMVVPDGQWAPIPLVAFLIAVEAILTTNWLANSGRRTNRIAYRAAELFTLLIAVRILTWVVAGEPLTYAGIGNYLLNPTTLFDGTFVAYALMLLFSWERASNSAELFRELRLDPEEVIYFTSPVVERQAAGLDSIVVKDRHVLLQRFARGWILGGFLLALVAAITTFDLPSARQALNGTANLIAIGRLGLRPGMLAALLIYFVGGLWLVSEGRLAVVEARWLMDRVAVDEAVGRRWRRSSLALLSLVAVVAAFLPIGSTLAISRILQLLVYLVVILIGIIMAAVSLLYFFLTSFFLAGEASSAAPPLDLSDLALPQPPAGPTSELPGLITGILFWIGLLVVSVVAITFFLRGRGIELDPGRLGQVWRELLNRLGRLLYHFGARLEVAAAGIRDLLKVPVVQSHSLRAPWRYVRLNALSPRDQMRYFYLSIVKRASDQGIERSQSETPLEYASDLRRSWPKARDELDALTNAFLIARYSRRKISDHELGAAKRIWRKVRTALRPAAKGN